MSNRTKILKSIMKKSVSEKPTFGTNPLDPWSAKANLAEDAILDRYLKSVGVNPEFAPKNTKVAHSKTEKFKKWKRNHMYETTLWEEDEEEFKVFDYKPRYFYVCPTATELYTGIEDKIEEDSYELVEGMAKLQDVLFFIEKHLKEKKGSPKEDDLGYLVCAQNVKDQLTKMAEMINPDMRIEHGYLQGHVDAIAKMLDYNNRKSELEQIDEVSTKGYHAAAIKSRQDAAVKVMSSMGQDKAARTKLNARNAGLKRLSNRTDAEMKKANSGPQKSIPRKEPTEAERRGYGQGRYMGDSVEHEDETLVEVSSELLDRYKQKAKKSADTLYSQGQYRKSTNRLMNVMKATGKQIDKTTSNIKKSLNKEESSKSLEIIKSLNKKKGNMSEDLLDHEKEDKSVATYGKKPKFDKTDEKESVGEKKPQAAAVMSGGSTLTGEKRDTVEIDPVMRVRPGQPDPTKKEDKKKDEKDKKNKQ